MDIQLQMQVQVSDHSAGSGTYRVLLFAGIIVLGLRKLPSANHCGLCPPSRDLPKL